MADDKEEDVAKVLFYALPLSLFLGGCAFVLSGLVEFGKHADFTAEGYLILGIVMILLGLVGMFFSAKKVLDSRIEHDKQRNKPE